ncbi:MAG TPA: hypothetical protein VGA05_08300 [Candidatus Bathyarchaeia archaeon]
MATAIVEVLPMDAGRLWIADIPRPTRRAIVIHIDLIVHINPSISITTTTRASLRAIAREDILCHYSSSSCFAVGSIASSSAAAASTNGLSLG